MSSSEISYIDPSNDVSFNNFIETDLSFNNDTSMEGPIDSYYNDNINNGFLAVNVEDNDDDNVDTENVLGDLASFYCNIVIDKETSFETTIMDVSDANVGTLNVRIHAFDGSINLSNKEMIVIYDKHIIYDEIYLIVGIDDFFFICDKNGQDKSYLFIY